MAYTATSPPQNQRNTPQVSASLHRLRNEGGNALNELKNWDKAKLLETLDWIQKNVPAREQRAKLIAVETARSRGTERAPSASSEEASSEAIPAKKPRRCSFAACSATRTFTPCIRSLCRGHCGLMCVTHKYRPLYATVLLQRAN